MRRRNIRVVVVKRAVDPVLGLAARSASKDSKPSADMSGETDMNDTKDIAWDDDAILSAAGARPEPIRQLLAKHNQKVPTDLAVYQWWSRRAIPNPWRPRLIYVLLREQMIDVGKLFRVGSCARKGPRS